MNKSTYKIQAIPGLSLWSYNMHTEEIEFVDTILFHSKEIENKTVKYYHTSRDTNKLYIQAREPFTARRKVEQFLKYKKEQDEKKQAESYQKLQG